MADPEIQEQLPLDQARWVVSTIRDRDLNLNLLRAIKERKFRGRVALTARWEEEAEAFLRLVPTWSFDLTPMRRNRPWKSWKGRPRPIDPDESSLK